MLSDQSAAITGYIREPKYRADSSEWHHRPTDNCMIEFRIPIEVLCLLEEAAERYDRTFNAQLLYIIEVCGGNRNPAVDDERTVTEWQALFSQMHMQFNEGEEWIPCTVLCKAIQVGRS